MNKYRLSFTFGGLLIPESRVVAEAYLDLGDWAAAKERTLTENRLGKTRRSTSRRYFREIRDRLAAAYDWEIDVVAGRADTATPEGDRAMVLFAIFSRYYTLVGDFVTQVVRPRFYGGLPSIDSAMFRTFMRDQEPAHPEIAALSESTREKLTTVAMRALREAGTVAAQSRRGPFEVRRPAGSTRLWERYCAEGRREDYGHLLWPDEEIRQCLR
ncbi:MAG: DUF1819 family protein [Spirochaetes bacterium]|jgi:hypothetical protein|nr:DUF1819 family protein [Spirochaetota bacterium]